MCVVSNLKCSNLNKKEHYQGKNNVTRTKAIYYLAFVSIDGLTCNQDEEEFLKLVHFPLCWIYPCSQRLLIVVLICRTRRIR